MQITYRPDIDGLRAVAVVLVVMFHAGIGHATGGFVGVDVFFVISGFLITSVIAEDMRAGTFSFLAFFERRVRRLLPAMALVAVYVFLFAYAFYLLPEFTDVVHSLIAVATFTANWHFMGNQGYFAAPADTQPLLHTWSLSIEEQFYLVFPALLFLTIRQRARLALPMVAVLVAASLAVAIHLGARAAPEVSYLNSFGRFYELLIGAAIALAPGVRLSGVAGVAARWIGMAAILGSAWAITEDFPFPSWVALIPTLGTALVILADGKARDPLLAALQSRIATYTGKVSYGFYLWHWPALVTLRYLDDEPSRAGTLLAVAAAFAAAVLSYHFVELPVRTRTLLAERRKLFGAFAGSLAAVAGAGAVNAVAPGMPFRFSPDVQRAILLADRVAGISCRRRALTGEVTGCLYGAADADPKDAKIIVWGDSLAGTLRSELAVLAAEHGPILAFGNAGCAPLLDVWKHNDKTHHCAEMAKRVAAYIRDTRAPVLLAAAWNDFATNATTATRLVSPAVEPKSADQLREVFGDALARTAAALGDRTIVVLGQPPRYAMHVDRYVLRQQITGRPFDPLIRSADYAAKADVVRAAAEANSNVRYVDVAGIFCPRDVCIYQMDGVPLYHDTLHLNSTGAKLIGTAVAEALRLLLPSAPSGAGP
jgi:peptidoglycan/LPS O-acetylase OafA/YrhL/lysophospholipase L1-like esterase